MQVRYRGWNDAFFIVFFIIKSDDKTCVLLFCDTPTTFFKTWVKTRIEKSLLAPKKASELFSIRVLKTIFEKVC